MSEENNPWSDEWTRRTEEQLDALKRLKSMIDSLFAVPMCELLQIGASLKPCFQRTLERIDWCDHCRADPDLKFMVEWM